MKRIASHCCAGKKFLSRQSRPGPVCLGTLISAIVFQDQRRMGAVTPGDTVPYTTSTSVLKLVTSLRRDEIAITLLMLSLGFARKSGIFSRILGA